MEIEIRGRSAGVDLCPYCREVLDEGATTWSCGGCGARLHPECHAELGRCPTLGCAEAAREPEQRPPPAMRTTSPPWRFPRHRGVVGPRPRRDIFSPAWYTETIDLPPESRAKRLAGVGAILGLCLGALGGLAFGGLTGRSPYFAWGRAIAFFFAGIPVGVGAGAVYGYLQGLVGLPRRPWPGGGCIAGALAAAAAALGALWGGVGSALCFGLFAALLAVRIFGAYHPGD
ncbi:MAG: hypothetical protein D6731_06415 [Planctomycetota bacterium]|nr:MAG: hypothetical protein D6731_06415 [Planctomycetota bacterium]